MKKPSAVFTDLDGTLIGKNGQISGQDLDTIKRLKEMDVPVFIMTGRNFQFCYKYAADIGLSHPTACANGAMIYDFARKETVMSWEIKTDVSRAIFTYLFESGSEFILYTPEGAFFSQGAKRADHWQRVMDSFEAPYRFPIRFMDADFPIERHQVLKFLLPYVDADMQQRMEERFNQSGELAIVSSGKGLVDMNSAESSKGRAAQFLCARYGIDPRYAVAVGDNFNDESMLGVCGYPVATANAEEDIKKLAVFVTTDYENSPMTHAIGTLFPDLR